MFCWLSKKYSSHIWGNFLQFSTYAVYWYRSRISCCVTFFSTGTSIFREVVEVGSIPDSGSARVRTNFVSRIRILPFFTPNLEISFENVPYSNSSWFPSQYLNNLQSWRFQFMFVFILNKISDFFSPSLVCRRILIRNSWFSIWGSGSVIINFLSGTLEVGTLELLFLLIAQKPQEPEEGDPHPTSSPTWAVQSQPLRISTYLPAM